MAAVCVVFYAYSGDREPSRFHSSTARRHSELQVSEIDVRQSVETHIMVSSGSRWGCRCRMWTVPVDFAVTVFVEARESSVRGLTQALVRCCAGAWEVVKVSAAAWITVCRSIRPRLCSRRQ